MTVPEASAAFLAAFETWRYCNPHDGRPWLELLKAASTLYDTLGIKPPEPKKE